jgi:AAA family ATP:ADP antiporter
VAIAHLVNRRQQAPGKTDAGEKPLGKSGAFELIFKDRYLLLIAVLFVVLNIVNTTGEYLMGKLVVDESIARFGADASSLADRQKFVGAFYGDFFGNVNLLTFLVQALAVARIIKYFGVGGALFVHPILAFIGYASLLRWPALAVVRMVKLVDNTMDYSLGNTAKQALWLPTSRDAKYKAKQAVDSFFMRAGDVLSAGVVFIGERFALGLAAFAAINVVLSAVWLVIAGALAAENRKRTAAMAPDGGQA